MQGGFFFSKSINVHARLFGTLEYMQYCSIMQGSLSYNVCMLCSFYLSQSSSATSESWKESSCALLSHYSKNFWILSEYYAQNPYSTHKGMNTRGKNWLLWKRPTFCRLICVLCQLLNQLRFRSVQHLKMTVRTSVLWKVLM